MKELMGVAVLAYRNGRYDDAIELLLQVVQNDRQCWLAWFYLAMSYGKCDNTVNAHRIFKIMATSCPDDHLRGQAEAAMPALEQALGSKFKKKSVETKKSTANASSRLVAAR